MFHEVCTCPTVDFDLERTKQDPPANLCGSDLVPQPTEAEETLAIWWLEELREGKLKFV
jgi:hypothetical protein